MVEIGKEYDLNDDELQNLIVATLCNKKEIANKIIYTLLKKRLVAGSQLSKIFSKYWWNNELEECNEYKLEFGTKESLFSKIENEIKKYMIMKQRNFLFWNKRCK